MSAAGKIVSALLMVGRACVGGAMIYSGAQLLRGDGLLSNSQFDSIMTGIFILLLGVYCIFSGVVVRILERIQQRSHWRE